MATTTEIETIKHRRADADAYRMAREGVTLTHAQADEIGDEGCGWLRSRLGLASETYDEGIRFAARCPVCGGPMPRQQQSRRVSYSGVVVCDRATCEQRADG